jgi:hypothetical protein
MCWPGPHNQNCEERFKNCKSSKNETIYLIIIYGDILFLFWFYVYMQLFQMNLWQTGLATNGDQVTIHDWGLAR